MSQEINLMVATVNQLLINLHLKYLLNKLKVGRDLLQSRL
jgi:hypothetical protein